MERALSHSIARVVGLAAAVPALVLVAGGCGDSKGLIRVSGVVKLDGSPVAGATVMFNPKLTGARPALGVTDKDGIFHLTTFKSQDGALRGEYKVTIQAGSAADPKKFDNQALQKFLESEKRPAAPSLIHASYTQINTTPFTMTVPPAGPIEFLLNKEGK